MTAYHDFISRAADLAPRVPGLATLPGRHREQVYMVAYETCAWIATLTDDRIVESLLEATAREAKWGHSRGLRHRLYLHSSPHATVELFFGQ